MLKTSNTAYPGDCAASDIDNAAGPDIDPTPYDEWVKTHWEADVQLRQRFVEENGADLMDQLLGLPRGGRHEKDIDVIRRHESNVRFVGDWRIAFVKFYEEAWAKGGVER